MIKRLERNRLDELENTIDVRSDRKEIARAMLDNLLIFK